MSKVSLDTFKDTILFSLQCQRPGMTRRVEEGVIDTSADEDWVRHSKDILKAPEWKSVVGCQQALARWIADPLRSQPVPGGMFHPGMHLVRKASISEIDDKVNACRTELAGLVEAFLANYEVRKHEARNRLGSLYNESDYPEPGYWRRKTRVKTRWLEIADPSTVATAGGNWQAEFAEMVEEVRLGLRLSVQEMVTSMAAKLEPGKIFKDESFAKFDAFLKAFDQRDLTDDADLKALVAKARSLVGGVDLEQLRDDQAYRAKMLADFKAVGESVGGMVEDQQTRLFTFAA